MADNNVVAEVAKAVYEDAGHEIIQPTGKTLSLIPRAVRAALQPLERWIMVQEYNLEVFRKTLDYKLAHVDPEKIVTPEPYVAVPALQAVTYCMDNEELRNMYANLLAKSMNEATKDGVHPAYVEIIKQLCPDEAKMMRYMMENPQLPSLSVRVYKSDRSGFIYILKHFSDITELADCEKIDGFAYYLDNLIRLGLIRIPEDEHFVNSEKYEPLKQHPRIVQLIDHFQGKYAEYPNVDLDKQIIMLTDFGKQFCNICIADK